MTVVKCPFGCGGTIDTATSSTCRYCRRPLSETALVIPEEVRNHSQFADRWRGCNYPPLFRGMETRKLSWCWEWFGSVDHRCRCRLPKGHLGDHNDHPELECDPLCPGLTADWLKEVHADPNIQCATKRAALADAGVDEKGGR